MSKLSANMVRRVASVPAICMICICGLPAAAAPAERARTHAAALADLAERARSNDWAGVSNAWRALDMRQAD